MGYTTYFKGSFDIHPAPDASTRRLVNGLSDTRRMGRDLSRLATMLHIQTEEAAALYGVEGEFYVGGNDVNRQKTTDDEGVIDVNTPPKTQPGPFVRATMSSMALLLGTAKKHLATASSKSAIMLSLAE